MGRTHPLLRLALFVAVAFGVFGMHTFGHPAGPDAAHASAAHGSTGHGVGAAHEIAAAPGVAHEPDGSPGHRDGAHAFTVCLAVLGGALVLGVLAPGRRHTDWPLVPDEPPGPGPTPPDHRAATASRNGPADVRRARSGVSPGPDDSVPEHLTTRTTY